MKLKNILLSGLSLVLVAALAIGGTVAYLQDDDSDVNVMTLGNVKIEQNEYERVVNDDGTYKTETIDNVTSYVLQDYTQGKPLVPSAINTTTWEGWDWDTTVVCMTQVGSYGGMQVFKKDSNAQDKFVVVKNTGKTDAYIRTIVAIEVGSTDGSLIGTSYHSTWTSEKIGTITVDGNNYMVVEYAYVGGQLSDSSWRHQGGVLPAGDTSYPNLSQVYLKSAATNEDMEAIDGNGNGTLDILVLSQAVQAAGFADAKTALDTAFGKSAEKAAEWFGGIPLNPTHNPATITVTSTEEAQAALNNAADNTVIQLTAGNYGVLTLAPVEGGQTTVLDSTTGYLSRSINGLTIKGAAGVKVDGIAVAVDGGNTISLNNIVIDGVDFTGAADGFVCTVNNVPLKNFTMKNCTMTSGASFNLVKLRTPENVTITNCTVDGAARLLTTGGSKNITITNNTINNVTEHGIHLSNSNGIHSGTIVVSNNTFNGNNTNARFIRFADVDNAKLIITDNVVRGYVPTAGDENDYIKITYKNDVEPDVTISGNKYEYQGIRLWISVKGEEYIQSTPDKLS